MSNKCNCQLPNTDLGGRCFKCGGLVEIPISKQMTPQERIKADAEAYANRPYYKSGILKKGYIAGATAENDRAQVLVDALEAIMNTGWQNYQAHAIAKRAIEQWKSGKGKELKEECTCSLTRIVTHGKCYKCPELTSPQK